MSYHRDFIGRRIALGLRQPNIRITGLHAFALPMDRWQFWNDYIWRVPAAGKLLPSAGINKTGDAKYVSKLTFSTAALLSRIHVDVIL